MSARRMRLALSLLVAVTAAAHADPVPDVHAAAPPAFDPTATVSVEPIFLLAGIVEANVEVKVAPHVGVQVLGGYGGILGATIEELGTEANVYTRPQLAGFHAGAMAKKLWGSGAAIPFVQMDAPEVTERELGVYLGWKWIGWKHLTAVVQGGVGRLDLTGTTDGKNHQVIPVANFVAGYSF